MKKTLTALAAMAALVACHHGPGHSPREGEARDRAAQAAATLVATDHADTVAMEEAILGAKAVQSEYAMLDDTVAVRVFDEAFRRHVRDNDPALHAAMFDGE